MICEAIADGVLGGTDKLLLHFDNFFWQYLGNCLIFFESMYKWELNLENAFLNFGLLYIKVLVSNHLCYYQKSFNPRTL